MSMKCMCMCISVWKPYLSLWPDDVVAASAYRSYNWHYTSELLAVPVFRVLRAFRVRTCQVTATYRLMPEDTSNRVVLAGTFEQDCLMEWKRTRLALDRERLGLGLSIGCLLSTPVNSSELLSASFQVLCNPQMAARTVTADDKEVYPPSQTVRIKINIMMLGIRPICLISICFKTCFTYIYAHPSDHMDRVP